MRILYNLLINLILIFSPLIIVIRLFLKKEHPVRFIEKFSIIKKKRYPGNLVWFHSVSIGELLSIIPLIEKFEKNKKINQILITSSTKTSAKLFEKFKFKKTIHQFFPIDNNYFVKRFINYWKPKVAIFVDSEIWPNMLFNLEQKKIKKILLNARISRKSYKKWNMINFFTKTLFLKFDYIYPQNKETEKNLKKLKLNKIKSLGNLKFSQQKNNKIMIDKKLKYFLSKKKLWCALSTHSGEEKICGEVHYKLLKKNKNLLLILIPRHIDRISSIINELESYNFNYHLHSSKKEIADKTNFYIVDTYGETEKFLTICKIVFLGKSLDQASNKLDGGQNPLEAARHNCKIIHGPNISNFYEIYDHLKKLNISKKITNQNQLFFIVNKLLNTKNKKIVGNNQIKKLGIKILNKNYKEIQKYFN